MARSAGTEARGRTTSTDEPYSSAIWNVSLPEAWIRDMGASESAADALAGQFDEDRALGMLQTLREHGYLIFLVHNHGDPPTDVEAAPHTSRAVPELARLLAGSFAATTRISEIAERLHVGPSMLLTQLANVAAQMPAGADQPTSAFTPSEREALVRAGSLVEKLPAFDELASVRTAVRVAQLEDASLTVKQVADLLDVTEGRVRQRLTNGTLLGSKTSASWRIPEFQFADNGELPGWDRIVAALPRDAHPLSVARFLETPDEDLEVNGGPVSPRAWLTHGGNPNPVVALAAALYDAP
jgi:hypothetical protein